jgi:hypothetical protein
VIIIQSDHGGGACYNHDEQERARIRERFGTLFAPQASPEAAFIRDGVNGVYNSVNIHRDIFATYFGFQTPPKRPVIDPWRAWTPVLKDPKRRGFCRSRLL